MRVKRIAGQVGEAFFGSPDGFHLSLGEVLTARFAGTVDRVALGAQPPRLRLHASRQLLDQSSVVAHYTPIWRHPFLAGPGVFFGRFRCDSYEDTRGDGTRYIGVKSSREGVPNPPFRPPTSLLSPPHPPLHLHS